MAELVNYVTHAAEFLSPTDIILDRQKGHISKEILHHPWKRIKRQTQKLVYWQESNHPTRACNKLHCSTLPISGFKITFAALVKDLYYCITASDLPLKIWSNLQTNAGLLLFLLLNLFTSWNVPLFAGTFAQLQLAIARIKPALAQGKKHQVPVSMKKCNTSCTAQEVWTKLCLSFKIEEGVGSWDLKLGQK